MKTKVAIVILNWNKPELTLDCLKSVQKLSINNYQLSIVVVDNASTDDSVKKLKHINIPEAIYKLIVNRENLGFAEGNNVGIRYAMSQGSDFVLVLNNDTILHENLIIELLKAAKNHPKAGLMSPKIYFAAGFEFHKNRYKKNELGKVIWSVGGSIDWNNIYGTNQGVDEVDKSQFEKIQEVDFASGACLFIRSYALKEVGYFDPNYFMYFEDTDLSIRMKMKGWEILYIPKAVIWHKVAQSSIIGGELNDYFITRNRLLFGSKYASLRTKLALFRESLRFIFVGRKWQRIGIRDYYLRRFGKGSWKN